MWTDFCRFASGNTAVKHVLSFMLLLAFQTRDVQSQASNPESVATPPRPELVVLMDTNADQQKVFAVEQSLALDLVQRLGDEGFYFSVISFGANGSRQIESGIAADTTLNAIRDLAPEPGHKKKVAPPELYNALIAGQAAFGRSSGQRAILVISGGQDDLDGKRFKQIKSAFRTQKISCHVAVVSWHPLYGTKGIQVRGFYLHDIARATHGKYVELGKNQKKVQAAVEKLVGRILQGEKTNVR